MLIVAGNVLLLSAEDDVEELFLCVSGDCCLGCRLSKFASDKQGLS